MAIVGLSVLLAWLLATSSFVHALMALTPEWELIGSFINGFFFTSVFTIAPSTVIFAEFARTYALIPTALAGGLGAMCGDFIIFSLVRREARQRVRKATKGMKWLRRYRRWSWLMWVSGGIIIASPLPDELGVAMIGISSLTTPRFLELSFVMNTLGILAVMLAVRSLIG